ncbi:MAG: R3H domain-containing nucleic acid-binding protein [Acidobacteriaceae bacterium]|jgi:spoIIIJ-associated protein
MDDVAQAAQTIAKFLQAFTTSGGLRLRFRVKARCIRQRDAGSAESSEASTPPAEGVARDGPRALYVEFTGPDTALLTARNGELLNALEHIATKILRLEPDEHDRVSFDADQFKANRDRQMRESAAAAIERVRATGRPHAFPPMTSRERRMLHMILSESGLPTASSGEGPGRFVVLYPKGADTSAPFNLSAAGASQPPPRRHDANQVRNAFRPRF